MTGDKGDFADFWAAIDFARIIEGRPLLPFGHADLLWAAHKKSEHKMSHTDWMPIKTAPRDGTFVLLCGGGPQENETAGSFGSVVVGSFSERGDDYELWLVGGYDSFCSVFWLNPTHWAKVPLPPEPLE